MNVSSQNSNRLNGVERSLRSTSTPPNDHQDDFRGDFRNHTDRIPRHRLWISGSDAPAGICGLRNNGQGEQNEEYWRNRAFQAEHTAAAVSNWVNAIDVNERNVVIALKVSSAMKQSEYLKADSLSICLGYQWQSKHQVHLPPDTS